jgi:V/A-type H+-transporting ATPase subunit F
MKYYVIGDEDTVLGFGMVGVRGKAVSGPQEAERTFRSALENKEIGIVIITERAAEFIRPAIDRFLFTENFPLIVEIPDRMGPVSDRPSIREMVNTAIGIKL